MVKELLIVTDAFWEPSGFPPIGSTFSGLYPGDSNGRLVVQRDYLVGPTIELIDLGFSEYETCCASSFTTLPPFTTTTSIVVPPGSEAFNVILDIVYDDTSGVVLVRHGIAIIAGASAVTLGADDFDTCCNSQTTTMEPASGTIFYMRLDEAAPVTPPTHYQAAWTLTDTTFALANAKKLDINPGAGQQLAHKRYANNHSIAIIGHAQFCSKALQAQSIPAGAWTIGYAASIIHGAVATWTPIVAIYLMKADGTLRSIIFDLNFINIIQRGSLNEYTAYGTVAGAAVVAQTGDYLLYELGVYWTDFGVRGGTVPESTCYTNGLTPITTDYILTNDAQSVLIPPVSILLT